MADGQSERFKEYDFQHLSGLPGGCPPDEAKPMNGTFYAFSLNNPPTPDDFRTQQQKGGYPDAPECLRRANSVFSDRNELKAKTDEWEKRSRRAKYYIATGHVIETSGVLKKSGARSHHEFWVCATTSMATIFKLENL